MKVGDTISYCGWQGTVKEIKGLVEDKSFTMQPDTHVVVVFSDGTEYTYTRSDLQRKNEIAEKVKKDFSARFPDVKFE